MSEAPRVVWRALVGQAGLNLPASNSGLWDRLFKGRTPVSPNAHIRNEREVGQDFFKCPNKGEHHVRLLLASWQPLVL